eukprot:Skav205908  [mRNA]  locus=scaffold123:444534:445661:+ [translate_table: standard]
MATAVGLVKVVVEDSPAVLMATGAASRNWDSLAPNKQPSVQSMVDGYTLPFKLKLRGCSINGWGSFWDCPSDKDEAFRD